MLRRLNDKCMYEFGWTLKQTALYITGGLCTAIFCAMWVCGMLPFHN